MFFLYFQITTKNTFFVLLITVVVLAVTGVLLSLFQLIAVAEILLVAVLFLSFYLLHHNNWKVKKFLEHKFWEVLSKMGLSIYLITSYFLFTIHEREVEPIEVKNELHFVSFLDIYYENLLNLCF